MNVVVKSKRKMNFYKSYIVTTNERYYTKNYIVSLAKIINDILCIKYIKEGFCMQLNFA